jgi:putative hydrolase of the HAD superfamily
LTWKEVPGPISTRLPRADDDKGWWRKLVHQVLDKCGVPRKGNFDRDAYFEELYVEFAKPGVWDVFPDTRAVLATLAGEYRLGVISNFDRRLRLILEELGIMRLFRYVVISSEVGADKPDPWIFQEALRVSGVRPSEALHVGDEPDGDWEGAARVGMQVFKLHRPQVPLSALLAELKAH